MTPPEALDTATLEELHRLARSRPRSGRQAVAKASALRTLERLSRRRGQPQVKDPIVEWLFDDSRGRGERVTDEDWIAPSCEPVRELFAFDTVAVRRHWYLNLEKTGRV